MRLIFFLIITCISICGYSQTYSQISCDVKSSFFVKDNTQDDTPGKLVIKDKEIKWTSAANQVIRSYAIVTKVGNAEDVHDEWEIHYQVESPSASGVAVFRKAGNMLRFTFNPIGANAMVDAYELTLANISFN